MGGWVGKAREMEPRQTGHRTLEVTAAWKRAAEAWRRPWRFSGVPVRLLQLAATLEARRHPEMLFLDLFSISSGMEFSVEMFTERREKKRAPGNRGESQPMDLYPFRIKL